MGRRRNSMPTCFHTIAFFCSHRFFDIVLELVNKNYLVRRCGWHLQCLWPGSSRTHGLPQMQHSPRQAGGWSKASCPRGCALGCCKKPGGGAAAAAAAAAWGSIPILLLIAHATASSICTNCHIDMSSKLGSSSMAALLQPFSCTWADKVSGCYSCLHLEQYIKKRCLNVYVDKDFNFGRPNGPPIYTYLHIYIYTYDLCKTYQYRFGTMVPCGFTFGWMAYWFFDCIEAFGDHSHH